MRLLLTTQPAYGHLHPLLPLADAARSAGHHVAIATSPLFAPTVEASGFRAIGAGLNWLEADKSTVPPELKPPPGSTLEAYFAQQFVRAPARQMAEDLVGIARSWRPDVIVHDRTEFGGPIAADALRLPSAAIQVGNPSLITPAVLAASEEPYNEARTALGLPPDERLADLDARPVLMFAPAELADPTVPLPSGVMHFRPTAFDRQVGSRLPRWAGPLGTERPLVYATLGTVFNNPSYELPFFPALIDGLRDEPLDVVLTVGPGVGPGVLGSPPANIHVVPYIAQSLLFRKVGVVVCHGGFGTVVAAIEQAIPLIVVPFGADQHLNAASVERLGIGITIDEDELDALRMREAVRTVLSDPSYRESAVRLRDTAMRLPAVDQAIRFIERMLSAARAS